MKKVRIFLTGGTGMVGRNFMEHPDLDQFEVFAPTRADLDLLDFSAVKSFLRDCRPDLVIHAAGKVGGIQANISEPVEFLIENLDIGRNVVWAAKQEGVTKLLNLGSSCMYPRGEVKALTEDMILSGKLEPTNEGYALAKLVTTRLAEYVSREYPNFHYKTVIPCNLYGRFDKFDPTQSHLIPAVIHKVYEAIQNSTELVEIWGTGEARREFMYAGDFADFLVRAIHKFDSLPDLMNVGVGYDHSINEYYSAIADVLGYSGDFVHNLARPVGMDRKLVNVDKQKKWGWVARHSLSEGIAKTSNFYLKECSQ